MTPDPGQHTNFGPRLKIGAVSYLNSKPLIEGLAESSERIDLILDYPSLLADRLDDAEAVRALFAAANAGRRRLPPL